MGAGLYNCERNFGGGGPEMYSNDLNVILPLLKEQGVTHLFIQKFSINFEDKKLREMDPISFVRFLESTPENFEKIYENGPSLSECEQISRCDGNIVYKINY